MFRDRSMVVFNIRSILVIYLHCQPDYTIHSLFTGHLIFHFLSGYCIVRKQDWVYISIGSNYK